MKRADEPHACEQRRVNVGESMVIEGVATKQLKVIADERGRLMECLRCDDELFVKFGQFYLTTTYPGVVKGWHVHRLQSDNIVCVKGMIKLVLWDGREDRRSRGCINEFFLGEHCPTLVSVPAGIWHGWVCLGVDEAYIVNASSEPYGYDAPDQEEVPHDTELIPYEWDTTLR